MIISLVLVQSLRQNRRVLVLYARGLRLLFTAGSPRPPPTQWAAAWDPVYGELLALAFTRHGRLSETIEVATQNFCTPVYLAHLARAERFALSQVMAKRWPGKGRAAPVQVRVEEFLAWVRRVMDKRPEEEAITLALDLLKKVSEGYGNDCFLEPPVPYSTGESLNESYLSSRVLLSRVNKTPCLER